VSPLVEAGGPLDSAYAAAAAIRRRDISPVELLEISLARVQERNPALNAIIWSDDEQARTDARRAADEVTRIPAAELAPFLGVPIPIKDLTPVAGWPTTYGSRGAAAGPAGQSAPVVDALRKAGFVLAGRTNTSEFGALSATENVRYGVTRNPWDRALTPGGSSGGAAAAVSAGMFAIAHGNDGGGSIRMPASCTGLVGLKVSRGRVPSRFRHWDGMMVEGVLTHDVRDTASILDVISGPDHDAWYNAPLPERPFGEEPGREPRPLRIGVQTVAPLGLPVAADCRDAVAETAAALSNAGHHITPARLDLLPEQVLTGFLQLAAAGRSTLADIDWTQTEPHIRSAREWALHTSSVRYAEILTAVEAYSRRLTHSWGTDFDILLTPTMACLPPPAGEQLSQIQAEDGQAPLSLLQMTAFTTMANLTGLPAISLPLSQAPGGIPVGVMLTAGPWQEAQLLRLAGQLERLLPWRDRAPG
jgi:amidase